MTQPETPEELAQRKARDAARFELAMAELNSTAGPLAAMPEAPVSYWKRFNADPEVKAIKRQFNDWLRSPLRKQLHGELISAMTEYELKARLRKLIAAEPATQIHPLGIPLDDQIPNPKEGIKS